MTIGLCLVCTGRYDVFLPELLEQVDRLFFPNDKVEVFLFTDKLKQYINSERVSVNYIYTEHKPFPASTLYRFKYFSSQSESLKSKCDYVFYMDVDMRIVEPIGHEILPEEGNDGLVGTLHCGFYHRGGSWEDNIDSKAYVPLENRKKYFAGGFQGGEVNAYMNAVKALANNIDEDERNGVVPIWHDESAWNCYLSTRNPKILTPDYCMVENEQLRINWGVSNFIPKIIALDKNHSEIRS